MKNVENRRQRAYKCLFEGMEHLLEEGSSHISDCLLERAGNLLEKWLEQSRLPEQQAKEQYTAALAYYLAGQYARAYVIMKNSSDAPIPDSSSELLRMMFMKALSGLHKSVFTVLEGDTYSDSTIAEELYIGKILEGEAVSRVFWATLHRSFALFLEFVDNGQDELLNKAIQLMEICSQLALDWIIREEWWIFRTAKLMLEEFRRNSLWIQLKPMLGEETNVLTKMFVQRYIQSAAQRESPVLELWRSQTIAIQPLNEMTEKGRPSFCVKMPTGSGKTRIAELAILRSIMDTGFNSDRKCLYIAPFRSLAVQVEASLRESFSPLGIRVSELYGGFDVNPAEQILFDETRILIATPEKMDALLRFDPRLAQTIDLIIIDEGHIIDSGERGLPYEMFLHRLVSRFGNKGTRLLFMSAVIQNVEDFTKWITGKDDKNEGLIESEWRVSKPILGIVKWDGTKGQSYYTHDINLKLIAGEIPGYLHFSALSEELQQIKSHKRDSPKSTHPVQGCLPFVSQAEESMPRRIHRRVFPKKRYKPEVTALAGIQAARDGSTLIFTCRPDNVETIAKAVCVALSLKEYIAKHKGISAETLPLPSKSKSPTEWQEWKECIRLAQEMTGAGSLVSKALQKGFIVHHGNISKKLRVRLEQLARKGIINLVIANNTLAQGVNLPVKTILIHSLHRYDESKSHSGRYEHLISATDFWNICGRAGRAMEENQGFVFILSDDTSSSKSDDAEQQARQILTKYIRQSNGQRLESALKKFLQSVVTTWSKIYPKVDFSELCRHLADNEIDWLSEEVRRGLNVVDKHLIALLEELEESEEEDYTNPQLVQKIFERSLLFLQLPPSDSDARLNIQTSIDLFTSRIEYLKKIPKIKRKRFYRTGLPIYDCQYIEDNRDEIEARLLLAKDYTNWNVEERCDYIVNVCKDVLFHLSDVKPYKSENLPDCWLQIIKHWLMGETSETIFQKLKASESDIENTSRVTRVIDEMCDFRLPMGFNALYTFMQLEEEEELLEETVPEVIPYFSSMLKYGVHSPVATILMSAGLENRQAALICEEHYAGALDPSLIYSWIYSLTEKDFYSWQTDLQITESIINFLKQRKDKEFIEENPDELYCGGIQISTNYLSPLIAGMKLIIRSELPNRIKLYTPAVEHLTTLQIDDANFLKKVASGRISATIEDIRTSEEDGYQEINIQFV